MPTDFLLLAVNPMISAVSGLAGVCLGGWLAQRNQRIERRQRRIREQLEQFYAPMLGYRQRLRARGELRVKVHAAADAEWTRLIGQARELGMEAMKELRERRWPEFQRVIEYDNTQLEEIDIPVYRQMLDLFTSKMHLAEPSTTAHLAALVEFIGAWDRDLTESMPPEVVSRVGADEENLKSLYVDLAANFDRLRAALGE